MKHTELSGEMLWEEVFKNLHTPGALKKHEVIELSKQFIIHYDNTLIDHEIIIDNWFFFGVTYIGNKKPIIAWLNDNISEDNVKFIMYSIIGITGFRHHIALKTEEDAMAFKLRW